MANWLIAQWARKRFLVYRIADYSVLSTGAFSYSVGKGQNIDINPRPDRLEYAFLRFLNAAAPPQFPVDVSIEIVFYDPGWPAGTLFPWPVPQGTIYELHFGFKVVLPRFASIQQAINFPPEYEAALNWCLARRLRVAYQQRADPEINALVRDALNSMRLANQAVGSCMI